MSNSIKLQAIGHVRSSRKETFDDNWDAERTIIELNPSIFKPESLIGLNEFSHAEVLFFMDQVADGEKQFGARHPRGDKTYPLLGVFAQRGKNRPNPIGLTVCRIVSIDGTKLVLEGLDAVDGTPVLDIKPWVSAFGPRGKVTEPPWINRLMTDYWSREVEAHGDAKIEAAIEQRRQRNLAAALELLEAALKDNPNDPMIYYQIGWTHDALGKESDALEPYKKALALDLHGKSRQGLFVGLSSTLRCLGKYEEALQVVNQACGEYPHEIVFSVLRALILNNLNRGDEAISLLLTALLDTTNDLGIRQYDRAMRFYSTRLRETFE